MQVSWQNAQNVNTQQPQYNNTDCCTNTSSASSQVQTAQTQAQPVQTQMQPVQVQTQPVQTQCTTPQGYYYSYPQTSYYCYPQMIPGQYQTPQSTAGVNIQIINPAVIPPGYCPQVCCPPPSGTATTNPTTSSNTSGNSDSTTTSTNSTTSAPAPAASSTAEANSTKSTDESDNKKKTEKRKIVQLSDEYIKNLESYLNSQDPNIRLSAAQEVIERLEEDDSRFDDKALTALINKMLQDPSDAVRLNALVALDDRIVNGDKVTEQILKNMQKSDKSFGNDAIDASRILLKMSGKQVEKEFEVKENEKKNNTSSK